MRKVGHLWPGPEPHPPTLSCTNLRYELLLTHIEPLFVWGGGAQRGVGGRLCDRVYQGRPERSSVAPPCREQQTIHDLVIVRKVALAQCGTARACCCEAYGTLCLEACSECAWLHSIEPSRPTAADIAYCTQTRPHVYDASDYAKAS